MREIYVDNQHKHIPGYRDLSSDEIDLINKIKMAGEEIKVLTDALIVSVVHETTAAAAAQNLQRQVDAAEAARWLMLGRDHLQQGFMALVRSVARPASF